MRIPYGSSFVTLLLTMIVSAQAQTLDLTNSTWGAGNSFYSSFFAIPNLVQTTTGMPGGTTAYGALIPGANSTVFGLASQVPTGAASYNLDTTSLTAGTSLHLVFTGVAAAPNYVAYTGGPLTGYSYNSTSHTLTINTTTVNPVASGSDLSGNTLKSAFGMIIVTGGSNNFGGSVFRSDMYWGDINPLNNSYTGVSPTTGLNVSGVNGALATFDAYMPQSYLQSIGISVPANSAASVLKSDGTHLDLAMSRLFYSVTGEDPHFTSGGYSMGSGTATYNFTGTGVEDYELFSYGNSSWSDGNIGISAVPEPSTYAALMGVAVLGVAAIRRRRKS